jgi:hypothetical protein
MANRDAPFGLRPVRHLNGNPWNGKVRHVYVPASDNTAIFIGDPVTHVGDSNDNEIFGNAPGTLLEVTRSTVGDAQPITGVVVGVVPVTADSLKYRAASTERVLMIVDDPSVVFEIQSDTTGLAADSMGLDAVLIATHAGDTNTGLSGMELDTTSDVPAADSSNQLRILSLAKKQDNALGAWAVAEVIITNHTFAQGNLGLGIA